VDVDCADAYQVSNGDAGLEESFQTVPLMAMMQGGWRLQICVVWVTWDVTFATAKEKS